MNRWMAAGLLGLPEVFSLQELKKAYAVEAKKHHPEDEPEYFRKLQEAYLCLKPYAKKVTAAPAETPMPTPAWEPEETEEETASEENGETTPEEETGAGPFGEPEDAEERQETASEENGETTPEEEPEAGAVRKPEDIGERQETAPEETGENAETAPEEEPEAGAVRKPEDIGERQETAPAGRPEEPAENPENAPEEETGPAGKPAGPDGGSEGTLPEGLDFERTIRAAEHRKKERELGISIALTQIEHGDAMIKRDVMADVLRGLTREQAESPEFLKELLRIIKWSQRGKSRRRFSVPRSACAAARR